MNVSWKRRGIRIRMLLQEMFRPIVYTHGNKRSMLFCDFHSGYMFLEVCLPISFNKIKTRLKTSFVPKKFGLLEVWTQRNSVPSWNCHMIFLRGLNFLRLKFHGAQISLGPKKWGAQMRSGTISILVFLNAWFTVK